LGRDDVLDQLRGVPLLVRSCHAHPSAHPLKPPSHWLP
jgi:hypothetical protein